MDRMVSSSSMFQVNKSQLFIPNPGPLDAEGRVVSLPSLVIHEFKENRCKHESVKTSETIKKHSSWDDVNIDTSEDYPVSCMQVDSSTSCIYIDSSVSSSSNSLSLSDTLHLVRKLTSIYDNQDSLSLLDNELLNASNFDTSDITNTYQCNTQEGEISLRVPSISTGNSPLSDVSSTKENISGDKDEDENSMSTSSSISPSHGKLGVPSKAAAILGAREIFTSPSHAAYRRLVDFTHRPTGDVPLLKTEPSTVPSLVHPSLTARSQRRSKPDTKIITEISPEKKGAGKYKIINMLCQDKMRKDTTCELDSGIDEMKEKFNFLRKPGDPAVPPLSDNTSAKSIRLKEIEKLVRMGKLLNEQIQRWNESFEQLLNDKYGLALFHDYLKSEYSEENIEFWIACEEFKTITNPKKMASRAQKIIKDFVTTQAPKEVNIDSKTRQITLESIQHPNANMFDMAQKRIQSLMEIDSYQRFLRSEMYQALMQDIKKASIPEPVPNSLPSMKPTSKIHSAQSSVDVPDSDSLLSLRDIRSSCSFRKNNKPESTTATSIIRISSVRSTRSDTVAEANIPPSSSENCLKHSIR